MPAKSEAQQKAAALALQAKEGKISPDELKGSAKEMYDSMSTAQLRDFAETKHSGIPDKVDEATTSESSGAYETSFGFMRGDKARLAAMRESQNKKPMDKTFSLTLESLEKIVRKTLIREEVYSEKAQGKGKDTSSKNAKAQKTYGSEAAKSTEKSKAQTGKDHKKDVKERTKKAEDMGKPNIKDKAPDVNKSKLQTEDQRIEAYQGGLHDTTYDYITDEKRKKNTEYALNKSAYNDPAAQDSGVNQQMIDDAKKRLESKENSEFRDVKVYGSDVEHIEGAESAQTKKLAYENTIKRYTFKKSFKDTKNMLGRIPSQSRVNESVFEMFDGADKYRIRWEGNSKQGVGVILEHVNIKEERGAYKRFMDLSYHNSTSHKGALNENKEKQAEDDIFRDIINESRSLASDGNEEEPRDLLEEARNNKSKYISSNKALAEKYGFDFDFYKDIFLND